MASPLAGPPPELGGASPNLDQAPPAYPVSTSAPGPGQVPVQGPNPANTPVDPKQMAQGLIKVGSEISQGIKMLGEICAKKAPGTAQHFSQAMQSLQTGLGMWVQAMGVSPAASPTETGDFQGGGFNSPPPAPPPVMQ